jgi:anti-anti-sigma factor
LRVEGKRTGPKMNSSIILVDGAEWDLVNSDAFEAVLRPALESKAPIIDLSRVRYLDSSCLTKIALVQKHRSAHGLLPASFVISSPALKRLFNIVGYDSRWQVYDNVDAALAANSAGAEIGPA